MSQDVIETMAKIFGYERGLIKYIIKTPLTIGAW